MKILKGSMSRYRPSQYSNKVTFIEEVDAYKFNCSLPENCPVEIYNLETIAIGLVLRIKNDYSMLTDGGEYQLHYRPKYDDIMLLAKSIRCDKFYLFSDISLDRLKVGQLVTMANDLLDNSLHHDCLADISQKILEKEKNGTVQFGTKHTREHYSNGLRLL